MSNISSEDQSGSINVWSWTVVSREFKQKLNLESKQRPKILDNKIVRNYLVNPCQGCTEKPCLDYHSNQRPRRELVYLGSSRWNYTAKLCNRHGCKSMKCGYAHTNEERIYHPEVYQTIKCKYELRNGVCSKFEELCPYAHSELSSDLAHKKDEKFNLQTFKTIKCMNSESHDRKLCLDYHKAYDRRRNLDVHKYEAVMCQNEECEEGDNCKMCHNQSEFLYHPANFKKHLCKYKENCIRKDMCPKYHPELHDRLTGTESELERMIEKCSELNKILIDLQEYNRKFESIICGICFENKSITLMGCGHTRCADCENELFCKICNTEAKLLLAFRLMK